MARRNHFVYQMALDGKRVRTGSLLASPELLELQAAWPSVDDDGELGFQPPRLDRDDDSCFEDTLPSSDLYLDFVAQFDKTPVLSRARLFQLGGDLSFQSHFVASLEPKPEYHDLSIDELKPRARAESVQLELDCTRFATKGYCLFGHTYAKELMCCREWCSPDKCGGHEGKAHMRRVSNFLERAMQLVSVTQMTVTTPLELRQIYRNIGEWRSAMSRINKMLIRRGYHRGIYRDHWFGELENAPKGQSPLFHPHRNYFMQGGYIQPDELEAIKASIRRILGVEKIVVHVQYSEVPGEMYHMLKYILRPTFLDWRWDEELARRVIGVRNTQAWGKWNDSPAWSLKDLESDVPIPEKSRESKAFAESLCPIDGTPITWTRNIVHMKTTPETWEHVVDGYWVLSRDHPPPTRDGP